MKNTKFKWKKFFVKLFKKVFETDVLDRGAQVAFYFSFALFPLLFFLISVFGLVLESTVELRSELFSYLFQVMPPSAYRLVRTTVEEIVESSSPGKLTLGMAITLWSASIGVDSMRNALNMVYELPETRPWWRRKLESLGLTMVAIILSAAGLGTVFYGWQMFQLLLGYFGFEVHSPWVLVSLQWVAIVLLMLFIFELIFNLLPNFRPFRWKWITPGSLVGILLWIILSGGFRLYLQYFNTYNRAYGSLGAVIILMLWLYLTAMAVLVGGAINSVIAELKHEPETPAAPEAEAIEGTA
ncbi:MAG: YihY/virulence factor BrkB family protein [Pyrinomonadaceae bacterium]|nr:YihY/virulence factor BrkB family protein [Pyrinomonadaceae bacterium]